jgi:hypothetical protein
MKKFLPYLVGGLVLLVLIVALMASRGKPLRRMDERITLRQRDKIPYGTAVARQLLPSLFPKAAVYSDARYPGAWDNIDPERPNQAVIVIADYLNADDAELNRLSNFVANGNHVFLIARSFSDDASDYFKINVSSYYNYLDASEEDTLLLKLEKPVFPGNPVFTYPGKRYEGRIHHRDTATSALLGNNGYGSANFIHLKKGKGSFFIHTSPLAFSNYFILYKKNVDYYQQALSVIPADVKSVLWNEYFLEKLRKPASKDETNWLSTLFKYPAFRWGFLTALFFLLLYLLLGMRRRQRVIPPYEKPTNESLDFVKTLGRLYFDKKDHHNLAEKMGAYFLEHVRSGYKIPTHTLDDEFIRMLHAKSGYPEPEIKHIVSEIQGLPKEFSISEERLAQFYTSLELFYQNT